MTIKQQNMNAVLYKQYGSPEVLQHQQIIKPIPKDNEVLIKVHATSVTVADVRVRSFTVPWYLWLPMRMFLGIWGPKRKTLGSELAGEIEAIGKSVKRFKVGDKVYADTLPNFGGYAEYICLAEDANLALKPSNMSYEEAATVPIGGLTAYHFLEAAKLKAGQRILIYGASGSVGTYAVQLAKHMGANVTGVCSGKNRDMVLSLGADKVIDYTKEDFSKSDEHYDVVFIAIDKCSVASSMKVLKKGGVYINITKPLPNPQMLWQSRKDAKKLLLAESITRTSEGLNELRTLIEQGKLKTVIDGTYSLDTLSEAHQYVEQGHKKGNVAIQVCLS